MADRVSKEVRSRIMSRIRGKGTSLEKFVFRELRKRKIHFQPNYRRARGTPDVALPKWKIAIFLDGDFWHGYRYPTWRHKIPQQFWRDKIERNRARDRKTFAHLRKKGWRVLRVWEHEVKNRPEETIRKIVKFINEGKRKAA